MTFWVCWIVILIIYWTFWYTCINRCCNYILWWWASFTLCCISFAGKTRTKWIITTIILIKANFWICRWTHGWQFFCICSLINRAWTSTCYFTRLYTFWKLKQIFIRTWYTSNQLRVIIFSYARFTSIRAYPTFNLFLYKNCHCFCVFIPAVERDLLTWFIWHLNKSCSTLYALFRNTINTIFKSWVTWNTISSCCWTAVIIPTDTSYASYALLDFWTVILNGAFLTSSYFNSTFIAN